MTNSLIQFPQSLTEKYRPTMLDDFVGIPQARRMASGMTCPVFVAGTITIPAQQFQIIRKSKPHDPGIPSAASEALSVPRPALSNFAPYIFPSVVVLVVYGQKSLVGFTATRAFSPIMLNDELLQSKRPNPAFLIQHCPVFLVILTPKWTRPRLTFTAQSPKFGFAATPSTNAINSFLFVPAGYPLGASTAKRSGLREIPARSTKPSGSQLRISFPTPSRFLLSSFHCLSSSIHASIMEYNAIIPHNFAIECQKRIDCMGIKWDNDRQLWRRPEED